MRLKEILIKIAIGILAGILTIVLMMHTPLEHQLTVLFWWVILLVVAIFTYACIIVKKQRIEGAGLLKILYENLDTEKFIRETEAAISRANNDRYKLQLMINLPLGYSLNGEYQKAIDYYDRIYIYVQGSSYVFKTMYYCNLASWYFNMKNYEQTIKTYSDGEKFIKKCLNNKMCVTYKPSIMALEAAIEYAKGNLASSEELLCEVLAQPNLKIGDVMNSNELLAMIYMRTSRIEKAKTLLEYNLTQKKFAFGIENTRKLLDEAKAMSESENGQG